MNKLSQNHAYLTRYTDQPLTMPDTVRCAIEQAWGNDAVQLYTLVDLDERMQLASHWFAMGQTHVALVRMQEGAAPSILSIPRSAIRRVVENPGLSCTEVHLLADPLDPALAVFRYTHRQRQAAGAILFMLRQQAEGLPIQLDRSSSEADAVYASSVAEPIRNAQALVNGNRLTVAWRLLAYLKPYRRQLVIGGVGAVLMTLVSLAPPFLTGYLLDHAIRPFDEGKLSAEAAWKIGVLVLSGIAAGYLLRELFGWIRLRWMAVLGEHVARDLRTDLYNHLHKLSVSYFSSKQTGSIISRVSSDTDRIWDFIAFGVVEVSLSTIMLAGLGSVLIALDWPLGLVMTVPVPFILWALARNGRSMQKLFIRAWRKWSNMTDVLSDTIPGIRVVKAFHQEDYERKRFNKRNKTVTAEFFRIHDVWTSFWPLLLLCLHLMAVGVWVLAFPRILGSGPSWMPDLSVGTLVSFLLYMGMFFNPIEVFGQMTRMLNRSLSSAYRIFEVLDTEPSMIEAPDPVRLQPVQGSVEFENVTFGYDPVRQILKGISFKVEAGEMIGLVGPSGAGKTTVVNLIARFYDATGGRISIDGIPIEKLEIGDYRRQIGMVLQDPYLFHGTILDNIRYGRMEASLPEVIEAARAANAHEFISKLPHGYDTMIGERGHTLSGGERQRVSIARAVLHNPRILILDEATSSVDTETEKKIQEALDRLVRGRTTFAIAHRLSTLTRASRLFVFKDGRLVEQGGHAELLADEAGTYRKLHQIQRELHEIYAV